MNHHHHIIIIVVVIIIVIIIVVIITTLLFLQLCRSAKDPSIDCVTGAKRPVIATWMTQQTLMVVLIVFLILRSFFF